jgi:hypothetical protein
MVAEWGRRVVSKAAFAAFWGVLLMLSGPGCRQETISDSRKGASMPAKTIEQVQQERTDEWMAIPGVVAVAVGQHEAQPCLVVLTDSNAEEVRKKIPSRVDGYPVIVRQSGPIRVLKGQSPE